MYTVELYWYDYTHAKPANQIAGTVYVHMDAHRLKDAFCSIHIYGVI